MDTRCSSGGAMPGQIASVLRFLSHAAGANEVGDQSDAVLLQEFVSQRSEDAFAALLQRHGPLVFAVCRRTLRENADAEDAFQATFLVLARKAGSIRKQETLSAWLHRVALNISRTIKLAAARRRAHERQVADMAQASLSAGVELRDWQSVLHEEVDHLPEKYRIPVVLCYLQGLTHEEAARRLGWPLGSVKGRLARAREFLRTQLARRGLTLTGAALTTALADCATAAVPPALLGVTFRAALSFATGGAAAGALSTRALTLATGAVKAMTTKKLIHAALLVFAAGVAGVAVLFGAGAYWKATPGFEAKAQEGLPPKAPWEPKGAAVLEKKSAQDVPPEEELARHQKDPIKEDLNKLEGTWHMVACEEGGKLLAPEDTNPNDFLTFEGTKLY